ncbi:MAG: dNTP triphosphohydrolase [Myxococcales bacterium]|nr:dNTP triphosphohydrolase [Myxococcales bacterium]
MAKKSTKKVAKRKTAKKKASRTLPRSMKWRDLLSAERLNNGDDLPLDGRSPYQVDIDRIIFSQSFRRLQDKTQVHPLSPNDHVRRRLTHSIEVASVGRSLATAVAPMLRANYGLKQSTEEFGYILQAACYAHDIGNTPFGHFGEDAIREYYRNNRELLFDRYKLDRKNVNYEEFEGFEGNAHGFHVLTNRERYKAKSRKEGMSNGLQLTYATLGAFVKYPWFANGIPDAYARKEKYGFFQHDHESVDALKKGLGLVTRERGGNRALVRSPLVYLVEAADDICYSVVDLEDGVELGLISFERFENLLKPLADAGGGYGRIPKGEERSRREALRGDAIGTLIQQVRDAFNKYESEMLTGAFDRDEARSLIDVIPAAKIVKAAKQLARDEVFTERRKLRIEVAAFEVIGGLLDNFVNAALERFGTSIKGKSKRLLKEMGLAEEPSVDPKADTEYASMLFATSFVAGMTDTYASNLFRQLKGISF